MRVPRWHRTVLSFQLRLRRPLQRWEGQLPRTCPASARLSLSCELPHHLSRVCSLPCCMSRRVTPARGAGRGSRHAHQISGASSARACQGGTAMAWCARTGIAPYERKPSKPRPMAGLTGACLPTKLEAQQGLAGVSRCSVWSADRISKSPCCCAERLGLLAVSNGDSWWRARATRQTGPS